MEYKIGDILFFKWDGLFHSTISIYNHLEFGRSDATHTAQIIGFDMVGNPLVCESVKEVIVSPYEKSWLNDSIKDGTLRVYSPDYVNEGMIAEFLELYKGVDYDWRAIVGLGLELIGIHLPVMGTEKMFCSENTVEFLRMVCDMDVEDDLELLGERIVPQLLYMHAFNIKQEKSRILVENAYSETPGLSQ